MEKQRSDSHFNRVVAVIPAAGAGIRMGKGRPKQFLPLSGKPLLALTLQPFQQCGAVDAIVPVVPSRDVDFCLKEIIEKYDFDKTRKVVPGGTRRQDSVRYGLEATEAVYDLVLIHDGVRPMITPEFITYLVSQANTHRAVITGFPAKDTIKEVTECKEVRRTLDRRRLWLIQTPQVFRYDDIMSAHQKAVEEDWDMVTDDAMLLERLGVPIKVIEGPEENIKVTTPHDLAMVRYLMSKRDMKNRT